MLTALMLLAAAATPQPSTAPARAPLTVQQRFDQVATDMFSGKCREALAALAALEAEKHLKPGSLPAALASVRKGVCLLRMDEADQGQAAIEAGLPQIKAAGAGLAADVVDAYTELGNAALRRWDYAGAKAYFLQALAQPGAPDDPLAHINLARATAFDGGPDPLRHAEQAISIASRNTAFPKKALADLHSIHARILMNQGRNAEAYAEFKTGLDIRGGFRGNVFLNDIVARSDLALAAKLNNDNDRAYEYLARSGAGRTFDAPFARALAMAPPACGTETGLRPEDLAIVDFAVSPEGQVISASTVYSTGSAAVAAEFARAVGQWIWDSEEIKDVPPFFLASMRVELRCSVAGGAMPSLITPLQQRFDQWALLTLRLEDQMAKPQFDREGLVARLRALETASASSEPVKRVAILGLLARVEPTGPLLRATRLSQAIDLAADAAVPVETRNALRVMLLDQRMTAYVPKGLKEARASEMIALLVTPDFAEDALAANTARMIAATPRPKRSPPDDARQLMQAIVADARLADQHPLKQAAHLRLASLSAASEDFAGAQQHFAATGLTEEQCALVGAKPSLRFRGSMRDNNLNIARTYGFSGWVALEFDVDAEGKTTNSRPIIAYPPFVYVDAAKDLVRTSRYERSYRPGGSNACSAERRDQGFVFKM